MDTYWGPRTASVDWCEENYVVTQYVAEFWNTLSSVPLVLSGLYGAFNAIRYGYGKQFVLPSLLMVGVGCGSIWFHGTLLYGGQVLDELSMVYCVTSYLYLVLETEAYTKRPWLPLALLAYNAAFTAVYTLLPEYFSFFVLSFIALCIIVFARSIALYRDTVDQRLKPLFWVGFGMYISAFLLFWVPDQVFCSHVRGLNLHAWFHVLSAVSTYWFVVYIVQRYYEDRWAEARGWSVVLGQPNATPKTGKWRALHDAREARFALSSASSFTVKGGASSASDCSASAATTMLGTSMCTACGGRKAPAAATAAHGGAAQSPQSPGLRSMMTSLLTCLGLVSDSNSNCATPPSESSSGITGVAASSRSASSSGVAINSSRAHTAAKGADRDRATSANRRYLSGGFESPEARHTAMKADAAACDAHAAAVARSTPATPFSPSNLARQFWNGVSDVASPTSWWQALSPLGTRGEKPSPQVQVAASRGRSGDVAAHKGGSSGGKRSNQHDAHSSPSSPLAVSVVSSLLASIGHCSSCGGLNAADGKTSSSSSGSGAGGARSQLIAAAAVDGIVVSDVLCVCHAAADAASGMTQQLLLQHEVLQRRLALARGQRTDSDTSSVSSGTHADAALAGRSSGASSTSTSAESSPQGSPRDQADAADAAGAVAAAVVAAAALKQAALVLSASKSSSEDGDNHGTPHQRAQAPSHVPRKSSGLRVSTSLAGESGKHHAGVANGGAEAPLCCCPSQAADVTSKPAIESPSPEDPTSSSAAASAAAAGAAPTAESQRIMRIRAQARGQSPQQQQQGESAALEVSNSVSIQVVPELVLGCPSRPLSFIAPYVRLTRRVKMATD